MTFTGQITYSALSKAHLSLKRALVGFVVDLLSGQCMLFSDLSGLCDTESVFVADLDLFQGQSRGFKVTEEDEDETELMEGRKYSVQAKFVIDQP